MRLTFGSVLLGIRSMICGSDRYPAILYEWWKKVSDMATQATITTTIICQLLSFAPFPPPLRCASRSAWD